MKRQIVVTILEPGKPARTEIIRNTLSTLQEIVGGYIELVSFPGFVAICNEEGRIKGMDPCCRVDGISFCGPVVFAGSKGPDFTDLPKDVAKVLHAKTEQLHAKSKQLHAKTEQRRK